MAFSTIEAVEKWFLDNTEEDRGTSWRIWAGAAKPNHDSGRGSGKTAEEAWNTLKGYLENMVFDPGEYITIRVYKNETASAGGSDMVFRPIPKNNYGGGQQQGIGGIGSQAYIAEQIGKEMTIYDLKHQVRELEAQINEKQGFLERAIAAITEHPNFDPNTLITGIGSIIMNLIPKRAQVGVSGFPQSAPSADQEEQESARIAAALERLQAHFPEMPLSQLLEDLAAFVDQNPGMAKTFLKSLAK